MAPSALACGGFFCSQTQPVNQAAERIVFADNGDGTVTAVIQILYDGPSQNFSWLLPISTVPEGDQIAVSSNVAFARLQSATNPSYVLNTTFEGQCKDSGTRAAPGGGPTIGLDDSGDGGGSDHGVTVAASGVVGAFEWTVIALDASLEDPAGAAVEWLTAHQYDVPSGAPALLRPYLEDGLYLLALRLTKGATSGSIRPIVLTYAAEKPMIPIKLTQVAANDDMGVLTWLLGDARAVPKNYLSLELNEARINWFNASANYNDVVIAAANDTGTGQGFVTEYSQPAGALASVVFGENDAAAWEQFRTTSFPNLPAMFESAYFQWGSWDGFWDAVKAVGTLSEGVTWESFQLCPDCGPPVLTFVPEELVNSLETNVIEPVELVQRLIDAHPQVTRLYTTLSAAEMTVDPIFTFNPDLGDVSNVHTANRIVECTPAYTVAEAPWRIQLPQGGIIRGGPTSPGTGPVWPDPLADQPANLTIRQAGETGEGRVLEDNHAVIESMLAEYNRTTTRAAPASHGCAVAGAEASGGVGLGLAGLGLLFTLRRRRQFWPDRR